MKEMSAKVKNIFKKTSFEPSAEVLKLFSCSTQLSMNYIMLINVKMPTIVGILIFMNMTNTKSESLKARSLYFPVF